MNIIENLISGKNRPGTKIDAKYLVIHWTANTAKGADADANRNYFNRKSRVVNGVHYELGSNEKFRAASAHYLVDDHKIVRALPENEMGYHVGAKSYRHPSCRNSNSVGIEMCVNEGSDFTKMRANTIELAADVCRRHGIDPSTHMIRHYDVTGKDCPHFYVVDPAGWAQFKAEVIAKVKGGNVSEIKVEVEAESTVVKLGSKGEAVIDVQAKLTSLGFDLGTVDGVVGAKTVAAIKVFQKANGLDADGIAGPKTIAKLADLIDAKAKAETKPAEPTKVEPAKEMPKVTSLGDKYSVQVKAKVATGVYKNADVSEKTKTLKAGTVFSVYGYTTAVWAVPGGFVQMKDVEPVAVTIKTGGLNPTMEADFRTYLKKIGLDGALNLAKGGNPSATITASGLDLVKVRKFLDEKGWYYK